jgi:hypothetical protein
MTTRVRATQGRSELAPRRAASRAPAADAPSPRAVDAALFEPLTVGERAEALRLAVEEPLLRGMAKIGRYRVVAAEPLVLKPPHERAGRRLARVVIYDYAGDQRVEVALDLERTEVFRVGGSRAQPMLSPEEEEAAIAIAIADAAVSSALGLGDEVYAVLQYWGRDPSELAHARRSAAVLFGPQGGPASLVAVVNLIDGAVVDVVPADQW